MIRRTQPERTAWESAVESKGLIYHTPEGRKYWDESAFYEFTAKEVDSLEAATNELWTMWLAAIQRVIDQNRFAELRIPAAAVPLILSTWDQEPPALHGRFDLACDGQGTIKALEFNADTPTALLEASVIQWYWLQDTHKSSDQFNSIHEKLLAKFQDIREYVDGSPLYFTHAADTEDMMTVTYLRDVAQQAGYKTEALTVAEIGWNGTCFVDLGGNRIHSIYKLYPWEWLLNESFGPHLIATHSTMQWIEPIWKMVASNKGILAILWELYPQHPLLLEAHIDNPSSMSDYVRKPLYSREGANVTLISDSGTKLSTPGNYDGAGYVYQAAAHVPQYDGKYPVIGSWYVIDQGACGMGIRESDTPITDNLSRFVPHLFQ
jgi:glutathionylspermidine synthase